MPKEYWSMPIDVKAFLASKRVMLMTTEEIGAYFLLLAHMWNEGGSLPLDDNELAQLTKTGARWNTIRHRVLKSFCVRNEKIYNRKLGRERARVRKLYKIRADAGSRGGKKSG